MKAAKKARQRKRRREAKAKAVNRADKAFATSLISTETKHYPHMEWNGEDFVPRSPAYSPYINVETTVMRSAHTKLGVKWQGKTRGAFETVKTKSLADTGCQTCNGGLDFLKEINCPVSYLVPTSHRIHGITQDGLDIIGSVMLRISVGDRTTRQMVHISKNTHGLYLSETALKELGVISREFPHGSYSDDTCKSTQASSAFGCCTDDGAASCVERGPTPRRPEKLPFEPTKENIPKFEKYFMNVFKESAFNTCTHQRLQGMTGVPMRAVQRKEGSSHPAVYTPIPVPFHWKKKVKADLDRDVRLGIIERVPQGETSLFCSRMVIVPKANGNPRRTVDFQELNKATLREIHHTPSPINLVAQIPAGKVKTVLDAWNGYHSLMLDPDSKDLTTFITEWGRYRYCRGPQGFHGTGDAYTRRFDDITSGEERYMRCIDDGLLYDDNIEESFWHTFDHLKHCADNGIVFNPEKFRFSRETVEFAGFEVTLDGYRPANRIIEAIIEFPTPKSVTDVRSWFGLVNQVAYSFSESSIMQPFRELLQAKKKPFYWDDNMSAAFQKSKVEIVRLISEGVRAYDLQKSTCLATDWSKEGLGFSLMQKHCKCPGVPDPNCGVGHWKLVFAGSKTTNDSQSRYSPTEGECLAAAYGLQCCRMYTLGCPDLILATDHNPLTGILNDRRLDSIDNPRLLSLKEKTLPFNFRVTYVKGGSHAIKAADALSRHPVARNDGDVFDDVEIIVKAHAARQVRDRESVSWRRVNEAAAVDNECVSLVQLIAEGFPDIKDVVPTQLRPYWGMKDELYTIENVPFKGKKMLIPKDLRPLVLEGLHAGHQGVSSMLSNARTRFFWPGMDAAVRQFREQCRQCNEHAPSQPEEPMVITPPPEYPFEQAVADLFSLEGHTFLAYADRFSGWLEVERLKTNTFRNVHQTLLRWFRTFGVPEELATDGGPPFQSHDYQTFLRTWNIDRRLSSAHYPQSNGRAEAAVKSAKRILLGNIDSATGLLDTENATRAILAHRNTPTQDTGISPSVMLFGRPLRDHLPRMEMKLRPEWDAILNARETALAKRALKAVPQDKRELEPLEIGDNVQLQNQSGNHPNKWFNTGVVSEVLPHRQYHVVVDGSRRITLRNRRFLKKISPVSRKIDPELDFNNVTLSNTQHTPVDTNTPATPTVPTVDRMSTPDIPAGLGEPSSPLESSDVIYNSPTPAPAPAPVPPQQLRRSSRPKVERKMFAAKLHGKSHDA